METYKEWFEIIMKQENGSLMTVLEKHIQADIGVTRGQAKRVANHILDVLDIVNENREQKIRNKAIDEFVERMKEKWIKSDDLSISSEFFDFVDEILFLSTVAINFTASLEGIAKPIPMFEMLWSGL